MSIAIKNYLFNSGSALVLHGERHLCRNDLEQLHDLPYESRARIKAAVLSGTFFDDACLSYLATLPDLKQLYLGGTRLTDNAALDQCAIPSLQVVNLDDTLVGDAAVARLKWARKLRIVSLRNTRVTDRGLQHIAALPNLQEYYLDGTQVTELGKRRLANTMYRVTAGTCCRWLLYSMQLRTSQVVRNIVPAD